MKEQILALLKCTGTVSATLLLATSAQAVLVDFTGGTVHRFPGNVPLMPTTNNIALYDDVDYYEESGIKFDFIGPSGDPFSYSVGDYYTVGNDVIHGHWTAGPFGDMESIRVEKMDGTPFDLNYFKITTNTSIGGGPASGSEEVYVNALADGITISHSTLLPPDDWGFGGPNSEIFLGSEFDGIKAFTFTYGSAAVGFGLDEFFIDQEAPAVPDGGSTAILSALSILGIAALRRQLV